MDAIQTVMAQIAAARERDDAVFEAESQSTLGDLYFKDEKWEEALNAYQQGLQLFQKVSDLERVAGTQVRLADVHMAREEWDQALALCLAARDTMEAAGDELRLARTYTNLGILYWQTGEWKKTLECYQKRLEILERVGEPGEIADVSANLGMLYQVFGHRQNASYYLAHGYMVARDGEDESRLERISSQLANILGSTEAANAYLRIFAEREEVMVPTDSEQHREALDGLLSAVSAAIAGDDELAQQLTLYTAELADDESQEKDTRALNRLLGRVLAGERDPDVTGIPPQLRTPVLKWLKTLDSDS